MPTLFHGHALFIIACPPSLHAFVLIFCHTFTCVMLHIDYFALTSEFTYSVDYFYVFFYSTISLYYSVLYALYYMCACWPSTYNNFVFSQKYGHDELRRLFHRCLRKNYTFTLMLNAQNMHFLPYSGYSVHRIDWIPRRCAPKYGNELFQLAPLAVKKPSSKISYI